MLTRALTLLAALVAASAVAGPAGANRNLFVGVSDDHLMGEAAASAAAIRDLGLSGVRLTLDWRPGQRSITALDASGLSRALKASSGARIIVAVYADISSDAPLSAEMRDDYCATVREVIGRFPSINDVVIWNEPNKSTFWKPQFLADGSSAAPAAYAALLSHCYQVLHAFRPAVNVIHAGLSSTGNDRPNASSNISHSPGNFIRKEGEAFRAGLAARVPAAAGGQLFDTFALHAYGESSVEPPWKHHDSSTIGLGDWDKLMQALWDAFHGTSQAIPGEGLSIWYLEMGFQTSIDPEKSSLYTGAENTETVPDALYRPLAESGGSLPDQATQLTNAIHLAYCQPYVDAIFNFLLKDERELDDWQSAPMWPDFTPKGSYQALKAAIQDVKADRVNCAQLPGGPVKAFQPKRGVDVEQVVWPRSRSFNWKNDLWRFRVQAGENAQYTATLYRAAIGRATKGAGGGTPVMTTTGELRKLYFVWVTFPRRRLAPGRYVMEIVLRSQESSARNTRLVGPGFQVEPPRR